MQPGLISHTKINPFVWGCEANDLRYWHNPTDYNPAERLIEYAARVCYHSTDRMGESRNFIAARVKEGHEDVIEHVSATILLPDRKGSTSPLLLRNQNPYCTVTHTQDGYLISANLRAWKDLLPVIQDSGLASQIRSIAPSVFDTKDLAPIDLADKSLSVRWQSFGQARIILLSANYPCWGDGKDCDLDPWDRAQHGSATFLIGGVSRAFSHQFVRARTFSVSQESQRYVDMQKGGWSVVIPPAIARSEGAMAAMNHFWEQAEGTYRHLRDLGIRKEDARFILPNATETRLVVSAPFPAWRHFNEQRSLDKAAQWEIRGVGQGILRLLYALAPNVFEDQHVRLQEMLDSSKD